MDEVIKDGESFAYSDSDIKRLLDDDVTILKYPELANCRTVDDILRGNSCACILYMTKQNFGHWTALIMNPGGEDGVCEIFDPYGIAPDGELKFIGSGFREASNQNKQFLSHILSNDYASGRIKEIVYNKSKLQSSLKDVNTCGRWCAMRCFLKAIPLINFIHLFTNQELPPDMIVTYMTIVNR